MCILKNKTHYFGYDTKCFLCLPLYLIIRIIIKSFWRFEFNIDSNTYNKNVCQLLSTSEQYILARELYSLIPWEFTRDFYHLELNRTRIEFTLIIFMVKNEIC